MQDVDGPNDVQMLSQPARQRGARVQVEPVCFMPSSEGLHGIAMHFWRTRDVRQGPAVRAAES